ncbi:MAG: hypothetical protein N3A54_01430 [Patescibacteria group bacterium]|nr:hypothetical protein [Patescibacteria group bacterium]
MNYKGFIEKMKEALFEADVPVNTTANIDTTPTTSTKGQIMRRRKNRKRSTPRNVGKQ